MIINSSRSNEAAKNMDEACTEEIGAFIGDVGDIGDMRADAIAGWRVSEVQGDEIVVNRSAIEAIRAAATLRETEHNLRLAVKATGLGLWEYDVAAATTTVTDRCREIIGTPSDVTITYELWGSIIHPDDRVDAEDVFFKAFDPTGEGSYSSEYRIVWPNKEIRWVYECGITIFEDHGAGHRRAKRIIGTLLDITDRKRAMAEAEIARDEAEAAARAKDNFLAILSHELRTPLTPVLMAISSLSMKDNIPDDVKGALEMIKRNIQTEASLIDDLLDLTRITRNKIDFQVKQIDLHEVIDCALGVCREDIKAKSLLLKVNLAAEEHCVEGDSARLQQVFWNLIKNAVKFTEPGGCISISSYNRNKHICVEVVDSGIGILEGNLSRIFNPFEQADQSIARQFGGLGLGLAISKGTIDAHGGRIYALSDGLYCGATFRVELETSKMWETEIMI